MKTKAVAALGERRASILSSAWSILIFVVLAAGPALAQSPAKKPAYDSYRMVRTRNIFDPDRRANAPSKPRVASGAPATASDYVALTGIMLNADKALAFFSGSRQDFNKVLPLNGVIAGATILKIDQASIEVERSGKKVTVLIGQTVPLDGSAPAAAPNSTSPSPASNLSSSSPSAVSPDKEALLRRMMERRQKELK